MRIDIIDTAEAFAAVRGNWDEVFMADPDAQHFLSWTWLNRYLAHRQRWFILALRKSEPGSPYLAFFPLRMQTKANADGIFTDEIIMAGNFAADYTGFITLPDFEEQAIAGFAAYLKQERWTQIKLDYFNGPPGRREALIIALQGPEVMFRNNVPRNEQQIDNTICPVIHLPDSWDGYLEQHMSGQTRQKLRRFLRKVEGGDEYRITMATPETIARDLDILFDFWRVRWTPIKGEENAEKMIRASREVLMDCFCRWQSRRAGALARRTPARGSRQHHRPPEESRLVLHHRSRRDMDNTLARPRAARLLHPKGDIGGLPRL